MITLFKRLFPAVVDAKNTFVESNVEEINIDEKMFDVVIDEWLNFHKIEITDSTYYGYKMLCPILKDYFLDTPISKIDTFYINSAIVNMKKKGISKAAINNYCKMLKMC